MGIRQVVILIGALDVCGISNKFMKRRIGISAHIGIGGGGPALMDGQPTEDEKLNDLVRACSKDAYETFFKGTVMDEEYCDAQVGSRDVRVGIEPSYMYQRLKMITIEENKVWSSIVTGYAWGAWGSDIRKTEKYYKEYKTKSKFVRFVDKWHKILFNYSW